MTTYTLKKATKPEAMSTIIDGHLKRLKGRYKRHAELKNSINDDCDHVKIARLIDEVSKNIYEIALSLGLTMLRLEQEGYDYEITTYKTAEPLCVICHKVPVDVDNGYDTCLGCFKKI